MKIITYIIGLIILTIPLLILRNVYNVPDIPSLCISLCYAIGFGILEISLQPKEKNEKRIK